LKFSGTITGSTSILALTNMNGAGVAVGIGVQITTNDSQHGSTGTPVKFDGSESYAFRPSSGKSSYTFLASYIRSPTAPSRAPGTANATATVTLTYS
jgi:type 1 fimbria pilin